MSSITEKQKFYITTTLPYVNADPHIGFAAEVVRADCLARWERQQGKEVFFNTGTDEHGLKIFRKAREKGVSAQEYVDKYAAKFDDLKKALNLSYNSFVRTTDESIIKKRRRNFGNDARITMIFIKKIIKLNIALDVSWKRLSQNLLTGNVRITPDKSLN